MSSKPQKMDEDKEPYDSSTDSPPSSPPMKPAKPIYPLPFMPVMMNNTVNNTTINNYIGSQTNINITVQSGSSLSSSVSPPPFFSASASSSSSASSASAQPSSVPRKTNTTSVGSSGPVASRSSSISSTAVIESTAAVVDNKDGLPPRLVPRTRSNQLLPPKERLARYISDFKDGAPSEMIRIAFRMILRKSNTLTAASIIPTSAEYLKDTTGVGLEEVAHATQYFPLPSQAYEQSPDNITGNCQRRLSPEFNNAILEYIAVNLLTFSRRGAITLDMVKADYNKTPKKYHDRGKWWTPNPNFRPTGVPVMDEDEDAEEKGKWEPGFPLNMLQEPALAVELLDRVHYSYASVRGIDMELSKIPPSSVVALSDMYSESLRIKTPPVEHGPCLVTGWDPNLDKAGYIAHILLNPMSYSVPAIRDTKQKKNIEGRLWFISEYVSVTNDNSYRKQFIFIDSRTLRSLYESVLEHVFTVKPPAFSAGEPTIRLYRSPSLGDTDVKAPKLWDAALHFTASWYSCFGTYLSCIFHHDFKLSWGKEPDILKFIENPNWMTKFNHFHLTSFPILLCMAAGMGEEDFKPLESCIPTTSAIIDLYK